MTITGKLYDVLKFLAQILLPAVATLYFALAQIWGLPGSEQVVGTIVAVDTFLGVLLGLSQSSYKKNEVADGVMQVRGTEGDSFMLELDDNPEVLADRKEVRLRVQTEFQKK